MGPKLKHFLSYKSAGHKEGFTLIELIVTMTILAVIAIPVTFLLYYVIMNTVVVPSQLNIEMIAADSMHAMIEGDSQAKGLRFCDSITMIDDTSVQFLNQDNQSIVYTWDQGNSKINRTIGANPADVIPSYVGSGIAIEGVNNVMFRYYDMNENEINPSTGNPDDVRRISVAVVAKTGTGSFEDWDAFTQQYSSVAVK